MKIHNTREALQVKDSDIAGSEFLNTRLAAATFNDVDLRGATFIDINLSQVKYSDVNLTNATIENANLTGMKINDVLVSDLFRVYRNRNRTGAVLFAEDMLSMQQFYQEVLKLDIEEAQNDHLILSSPAIQLVIHAIPQHLRSTISQENPPRHRVEAAIKLIFEVGNIAQARSIAPNYGGEVLSSEHEWTFQGFVVCDGNDPEGNIVQLRQRS